MVSSSPRCWGTIEEDLQLNRTLLSAGALALLVLAPLEGAGKDSYEVWAIDQSNSAGLTYGGTIHIWDGHDLEQGHRGNSAVSERIDLAGAAAAMCFAKTGANPVRPHMLAINRSQTHAIVSFVASGHVLFLDAATRTPVDCIRTSIGDGGARQVHFAIPSADETYIAVANQNGKLFERIETNYGANQFVLNTAAGIDLANCTTPNGVPCQHAVLRPDNAPICPIIDSTSRYSFVTLRGGGLFVVDSKATPMSIVAEYDRMTIHPNGCLGAEVAGKMYIDSGGGTPANIYEADLYVLPSTGYSPLNPPNVPAPKVVFSEDVEHADSHGAALTRGNRYLWVADRGRNFLWVVDTADDQVINRIPLQGARSSDPTPDLIAFSPNGSHAFLSLRGPNPLSADPHVSTGSTPGVAVLKVLEGGRNGYFETVARVSNMDRGVERADVHALSLRVKR
jgi:DNA-binding beta-propeller fold protein YncE